MNPEQYDREAAEVGQQLPTGPRVAVIGSASFWGDDSRSLCEAIGGSLATMDDLVLLTGGVPGVGEAVGRAFFEGRRAASLPPNTFHVLPHGAGAWEYGVTLFGGSTMEDRREVLGRVAPVYLSIEGGPGTAHEAEVAQGAGAKIVPVGRTGGCSSELHERVRCPADGLAAEWRILNDRAASPEELAEAVRRIIVAILRPGG